MNIHGSALPMKPLRFTGRLWPSDSGQIFYSISWHAGRLGVRRTRKRALRFALLSKLLEDTGYLVGELLPVVFCPRELHAAFGDLPPQLRLVDQDSNLIGERFRGPRWKKHCVLIVREYFMHRSALGDQYRAAASHGFHYCQPPSLVLIGK